MDIVRQQVAFLDAALLLLGSSWISKASWQEPYRAATEKIRTSNAGPDNLRNEEPGILPQARGEFPYLTVSGAPLTYDS